MEQLRNLLEDMGFMNVKTVLNSGNIIFDSSECDSKFLTKQLEAAFAKEFGFPIDTLIRRMDHMLKLANSNPFAGIQVTPQTRLYITFLSEEGTPSLPIPYESPEKDMKILAVRDRVVVSVITITENKNTTDMMKILEKEFGKRITTRNWNTVQKIAALQ